MDRSEVIGSLPRAHERRFDLRVLLAFVAIYFLWGGTYLAIRIAVLQIPPFFTASLRFFTAGAVLYVFMRLCGRPGPSAAQWRSIAVTALCMFVDMYGGLLSCGEYVVSRLYSGLYESL